MPNSKQIHQWNILDYWICISCGILPIKLISNLPLKRGWSAVLLLSSSEFYLTAEGMESKLGQPNLRRGRRHKAGFSFGAESKKHSGSGTSPAAGGEQQSPWELPGPAQLTWTAHLAGQGEQPSTTLLGVCPADRLKGKERKAFSREWHLYHCGNNEFI